MSGSTAAKSLLPVPTTEIEPARLCICEHPSISDEDTAGLIMKTGERGTFEGSVHSPANFRVICLCNIGMMTGNAPRQHLLYPTISTYDVGLASTFHSLAYMYLHVIPAASTIRTSPGLAFLRHLRRLSNLHPLLASEQRFPLHLVVGGLLRSGLHWHPLPHLPLDHKSRKRLPQSLTMSTIQNLKNFIRHGKQARDARTPPDQATTHVSNVHAQQHRGYQNYNGGPPAAPVPHTDYAMSDPNVYEHKPLQAAAPRQDYSAAVIDNRNVAAKAGHAAAGATEAQQKREQKEKDYDASVLERIVAEERESKGKLPRYPGLERWTLVEKMGDGAFSNVYRAKDNQNQYDEVAIKVVRKFEMNSTQVSKAFTRIVLDCVPPARPSLETSPTLCVPIRAVTFCTPTSRRRPRRQWRCAVSRSYYPSKPIVAALSTLFSSN